MKSYPNVFPSERANNIITFLIDRGNQARLSGKVSCRDERELARLACERYPSGEVELPDWVFQGSLN